VTASSSLRLPLRAAALAVAVLGAVGAAGADVVTTREGVVLEGSVRRDADGTVRVATPEGEVALRPDAVASVVPGEGPRTRHRRLSAALAPDDVAGRYRLALRLEGEGAADLARLEYEAIVRADPDHLAARRALGHERVSDGEWGTREEAMRRRGLVLYGGRWLLPAEADAAARASASAETPARAPDVSSDARLAAALRVAATGDPALARAAAVAVAEADPARRFRVASALLYDVDPRVRARAAADLASLGDEKALRPLILSGMRDRDPSVRRAAVLAAASFGHEDTAVPFVRALYSTHPSMVANAAQALALVGDPRSVVHVVKRLSGHGAGARSVIEGISKVTYVRDYEVEVAQAANIANPEIGVAMEGIVLDAKVLDLSIERTWVETVLLDSLNALAGTNLRSREEVVVWYRDNAARLPDFAKTSEGRRDRRPTTPSDR
jgi:hypothetical protein